MEKEPDLSSSMSTAALECDRHGEGTRLTCVDCDQPICPRCMVRTEVGLKCDACSRPAEVPASARRASALPLIVALAGLAMLVVLLVFVLQSRGESQRPAAPEPAVGTWTETPNLATIRGTATAVVLRDGSVLVAGGGVGAIPLDASEVFDPGSGQWRAAGPLAHPRRGHQAAVLGDGRVLVAGGISGSDLVGPSEVYDPSSGKWSQSGTLTVPRVGHSLTMLADGRVLVTGGTAPGPDQGVAGGQTIRPEASAEIWDAATGNWTAAGMMGSARFEHTATLLADGRILVAGGIGPLDGRLQPLATSELYDPAAQAFVRGPDLVEPRTNHAAVLDGERVMVTGGAGGAGADVSLASTETFDPLRATWTRVAPLAEARTGHTLTRLADGRVLAVGGEAMQRGTRRSLTGAEIFEPGLRRWRSAGNMRCPRSEQAAALVTDGTVLIVAGDAAFPGQPPVAQSCAERYRP